MKNKKKRRKDGADDIPVIVTITYDCIYDDHHELNVQSLLEGIPSFSLLHYIVRQHNKVIYSFGNSKQQCQMLRDMCTHLPKKVRERTYEFMRNHDHNISYIDNYSSLLLMGLIVQNFTFHEVDDDELDLCEDEYEEVFKAILYCNQWWTNIQTEKLECGEMTETLVSLRLELPIVEFKQSKDFRAQMYKALCFFQFCEKDPKFSVYLESFCKVKSVEGWRNYIENLFSVLEQSIYLPYIYRAEDSQEYIRFLDNYVIGIDSEKDLHEVPDVLKYFRDHFLLKLRSENKVYYLLLNVNLLIDKFYQGMKFDFYNVVKNYFPNDFKSYPDFSSSLGEKFSESHLFCGLMHKIYCDKPDVLMLRGEEFKKNGVLGEPDLYLRIDNSLLLFEYKDITLGDDIKYSTDIRIIKSGICDRICKYEENQKKKGVGQLLYNIERLFCNNLADGLDLAINDVREIYPIVITTDRAFSAIGVNSLVIQEFNKMIKSSPLSSTRGLFIYIPVIIELDILIILLGALSDGALELRSIIREYIEKTKSRLIPFTAFIQERYKEQCSGIFNRRLFEDLANMMR